MEAVKKHLREYIDLKERISEQEEVIYEKYQRSIDRVVTLRSSIILPAIALDGMPHGTGGGDKIGDTVAQITDIMNYSWEDFQRLNRMHERAQSVMQRLSAEIQQIDDSACRRILMFKYINGMTWRQISKKLGYAEPYCRNTLHKTALNKFKEEVWEKCRK